MNDYAEADAVEEVAVAERKTFDLHKRLAGITNLTKTVTVFTDLEAGEAHREAEKRVGVIGEGAWGLRMFAEKLDETGFHEEAEYLNKRAETHQIDMNAYNEAEEESARLQELLLSTALTFKIQGVPEIVVKKANREVRKAMGIKGSIPDGKEEEYQERIQAQVISAMIVGIKDHQSGGINDGVDPDGVIELADRLYPTEYAKILEAATELRNGEHFSGDLVDSVDF